MTPLRMMKTGETHLTAFGELRSVFTDSEGRRWIIAGATDDEFYVKYWWRELPLPALANEAKRALEAPTITGARMLRREDKP